MMAIRGSIDLLDGTLFADPEFREDLALKYYKFRIRVY
jgi:hypothetical protein